MNERIHILNPHGLGDIVMMIPLVATLVEKDPISFSITVKGKLEGDILKLFFPDYKFKFIYLSELKKKYKPLIAAIVYVGILRRLKVSTIYTAYAVHPSFASIISFMSGAKNRIGWESILKCLNTVTKSPISNGHKVLQHLSLVDDGVDGRCIEPQSLFKPDNSVSDQVISYLKKRNVDPDKNWIILAPGSGVVEAHKRWPAEKFSALIKKMTNVKFVLVGSEIESELGKTIEANIGNSRNCINLIGHLSIQETAHLLHMTDIAICNCNGISHLASAVGAKVIGLYGPTNPDITGPLSPNLIKLSLDLECSPCYGRGTICGCGDPICMTDLPLELVAKQIETIFDTI